eukprot:1158630-Pelagomonas_calceolata.AAC.5
MDPRMLLLTGILPIAPWALMHPRLSPLTGILPIAPWVELVCNLHLDKLVEIIMMASTALGMQVATYSFSICVCLVIHAQIPTLKTVWLALGSLICVLAWPCVLELPHL